MHAVDAAGAYSPQCIASSDHAGHEHITALARRYHDFHIESSTHGRSIINQIIAGYGSSSFPSNI